MWIYSVNHSKGFALVNNSSQIDGGMHDTVVNDAIDLGDTVLRVNPSSFCQQT